MLGEPRFVLREILARRRDDRGVEPEPGRDFEREAPPRRAVDQLIGRLERVGIEPEGRGHDSVGRGRVGLERVVVARRDHGRVPAPEVIDDGHAERAALDRVRARPDLVEQDQRWDRQRPIHRGQVPEMGREGAQARSIDCSSPMSAKTERKTGHARSVGGRNPQTGLGHQGEQSGGLQRDRLAAGVRSGDQQSSWQAAAP